MQELTYSRRGDYFVPNIKLPDESRPMVAFCPSRKDGICKGI